ncbi:MAG: PQQ-dependent sugar dehydrogenase [Planctomycetes bacterium]|nr:PQQ-dependent sugar dehydrogenase [Planctomycetota bacterium]
MVVACGASSTTLEFEKAAVTTPDIEFDNLTSLAFGPDGRLYVAQQDGTIYALTLATDGTTALSVEIISTDTTFDDVLGIAFDPGEAPSPVRLYVSSAIPFQERDGDPFPGKVWLLEGPSFLPELLIDGLPTSHFEHATNGIAFGPDGRLYIQQGATTNAGVSGDKFFLESPLSGATLVADIHSADFNGHIEYAEKTDNQIEVTSGDVIVFASGMRNAYDLVFHSNERLYGTDNGPDVLAGLTSLGCEQDGPEVQHRDEVNLIVEDAYYGHPNRNRGRLDARQCTYHSPDDGDGDGYTGPIATVVSSSNGIAEYKLDRCGLGGNLIYVSWAFLNPPSTVRRLILSENGEQVLSDEVIAEGDLGGPLDVTVGPNGVIYVAEFGGRISAFTPTCGADPTS